jgi:hypothetical protein
MKCSKCPNYSFPLRRCLQGKINPLSSPLKEAVKTAQWMGISYFCGVDQDCLLRKQKITSMMIG